MNARPLRYRKRPLVIEACEFTEDNGYSLAAWCEGTFHRASRPGGAWIIVPTLEGPVFATVGDYIACGTAGEFYPIKRPIFETVYEQVQEVPA